ncbi:MAG: methylated-DNA--[protein]-cysteine S-methyltransferase [Verrucomicrobia bacterium]|nr:methylated-DNA--[protein]-cysteine S-methyltransferase [Verrucomicrobiota bacterium]
MTPTWVTPAEIRDRQVFLGRRGEMSVAVTSAGELVLRLPQPLAVVEARLSCWGLVGKSGKLPKVRVTLAVGTTFQHRVWQACQAIPAGSSLTYGALARRIGCRSAQAVGQALGANPLAQLIPCHRVAAATGTGGFAWGARRKAAWLREEANESA